MSRIKTKKANEPIIDSLVPDVENLVHQTTVAEATVAVWQQFEDSLAQLDEDSLVLFREYLEGTTVPALSKSRNLSEDQVSSWIAKIKREIFNHIRQRCNLRQ